MSPTDVTDIPLAGLVAELRKLCLEEVTGNFYMVAESGLLIQFSLLRGDIVYIFTDGKRGEQALAAVPLVRQGHTRFVPGTVHATKSHQLSTQEILTKLELIAMQGPAAKPAAGHAARPAPASGLSDAAKAILEEELTEFIGPFASIVCGERLAGARDLESALVTLSQELSGPEDVAKFEKKVRARLSK